MLFTNVADRFASPPVRISLDALFANVQFSTVSVLAEVMLKWMADAVPFSPAKRQLRKTWFPQIAEVISK
jgi:hypothetical protein